MSRILKLVWLVAFPLLCACGQPSDLPSINTPSKPYATTSDGVPLMDISDEMQRQVVVAAGTEEIYQGHPTTALLSDKKTIVCTWSFDHGGRCGPLAKSADGGLSWTPMSAPSDWATMYNCPSIYLLTDKSGTERLMVFAAKPDMAQTWSEDGGQTWTPVRSLNKPNVMAFSSIIRLENGDYLGLYHQQRNVNGEQQVFVLQSISQDGGVEWGESKIVAKVEGLAPCEPEVLRSPDGKKLLCIMRENTRKGNSLFMVSEDEGESWSTPAQTPWGLTGDRHKVQYTPDGRIVAVFRDMAHRSPSLHHFVAWVGTFDDILSGANGKGQYRVKLLHSNAGWDCGYPGLELLPDGTFVATTYIKYKPGNEKHSVVSVRFKIDELDKML